MLLWKSSTGKWRRGKEGWAWAGYGEASAKCLGLRPFYNSLSFTKPGHDIPKSQLGQSQGSTHLFNLPSVCLWGVQVLLALQPQRH